ncbi:MAG: hypothetical protein PVG25_04490 [Anaerolineae bacterium]
MASPDNPYDICTWRPDAECAGCTLAGQLKCRFERRHLLHFLGTFATFAIPAVIGVIQSGYGWALLGWAAFCLLFFELWEIRILCSHCPYYAERGRTLHCIANYGSLKVWRYRPEPMDRWEKLQLRVGFAILGGFPFPFMLLGGQYLWAISALWALAMLFWTLSETTCSRCVNFSCPLNTVPREIVDAYLARNPVMRQAWEESGWSGGSPR